MPHHDRGPDGRLPTRHRQDHHIPFARRRRNPPRRRNDQPRRPDQPAFRLDAREADLPRARFRCRGEPRPSRAGRVPHPWCLHEHPVPPGRPRRPRLHRRQCQHLVHRGAARAFPRPRFEGPRHEDAELAGRRHGQPAQRRAPRNCGAGGQAPEDRPERPCSGGIASEAPRARPGRFRAGASRPDRPRRHRDDVPRRAPVAAGHAGAHPGSPRGGAVRRPAHPRAAFRRGLGRCHLRRGAPVPRRGPVGPPGRSPRGPPEHQHPDAPARPQYGRLHAVPDPGDRCLRARGGSDRCGYLPHLRRPQRRLADAPGDRVRARDWYRDRRSGRLLHRRPARPGRRPVHPRLLPGPRRADRRFGRAHPRDQGHGGPASPLRRGEARVGVP